MISLLRLVKSSAAFVTHFGLANPLLLEGIREVEAGFGRLEPQTIVTLRSAAKRMRTTQLADGPHVWVRFGPVPFGEVFVHLYGVDPNGENRRPGRDGWERRWLESTIRIVAARRRPGQPGGVDGYAAPGCPGKVRLVGERVSG